MNQPAKGYVAAEAPRLCYDMSIAPLGAKVLALTNGGVLVFAVLNKHTLAGLVAWCPLPKRDKEEEKRRGLRI